MRGGARSPRRTAQREGDQTQRAAPGLPAPPCPVKLPALPQAHPALSAPAASTNMLPVAWQCTSTSRAERCSAVKAPSRLDRMCRTGGPSLTRNARAVEEAIEESES